MNIKDIEARYNEMDGYKPVSKKESLIIFSILILFTVLFFIGVFGVVNLFL